MYCKQCGAEIEDGAKVCEKCGGQQEAAQKNAEGKCISMRWKIFTCVKTALLLIPVIIYILFVAIFLGFIGQPKRGHFSEFWEVAEYSEKVFMAETIKWFRIFAGASFVIVIILLIPTFLIFRGKKSKVLTVFEVLSSTISVLLVVFFLFLVSQFSQSF